MKKIIAFFGLLSISLTTVAALAQSSGTASDVVSRKALASLIKHSRSVKLAGDVRDDGSEKITDILATAVLTSSSDVSITNRCVVADAGTDKILNCELETLHQYAEQVLRYSVKIQITNGVVNVLGLHSRVVQVVRGS